MTEKNPGEIDFGSSDSKVRVIGIRLYNILSPVQTVQHCCMQHHPTLLHATCCTVWTPCCTMLHDVARCCVKFDLVQTSNATSCNISIVLVVNEPYLDGWPLRNSPCPGFHYFFGEQSQNLSGLQCCVQHVGSVWTPHATSCNMLHATCWMMLHATCCTVWTGL